MTGFKVLLEEIKGDNPGKVYIISRGTTRIGRKNADINISNERISGMHAEVHYGGTRVFVMDRNSTNGTFVNGQKVKRIALKDGDVISLGGISEKAAAVFKLSIEGELKKIVYIINKGLDSQFKYLYMLAALAILLFFVWLILPSGPKKNALPDGNRPWESAQDMVSYSISGKEVSISLGDTVLLPADGEWKTDTKYETTKDDGTYEPRLYFVHIYNDASSKDKIIESSVTIQRFKHDFSGDIEGEKIKSFIWHETKFLKDNNIDKRFSYAKTKLCVWQWIIWQDPEKFNLYATCVTQRGRILLQAAAFDIYSLKKYFQYLADSYKEGSITEANPLQ